MEALAHWAEDTLPEFLQKVENFVYEFNWEGQTYVLRLTAGTHRSQAQVEAELDWMRHLAEHGVPVVRPVPDRDGCLVRVVKGEAGSFSACVFTKATGDRFTLETATPEALSALSREWGRLFGRMHRLARTYQPPPGGARRFRWDEERRFRDALDWLPAEDREGIAEYHRVREWLADLPEPAEAFGLIHADGHAGNFLVEDERLTLFDFDDCCYCWFAFDLAMPIYYSQRNPAVPDWGEPHRRRLLDGVLEGYAREHALDAAWIDRIWSFLRLRRLQIRLAEHEWRRTGLLTPEDERTFARHWGSWTASAPLI